MNPKLMKILVTALVVITIGGAVALYFVLNNSSESEAMTIDEMVDYSYTTSEMRTDLEDGSFVLIQFQFVTNSKAAKAEIEKREFQVKNEFIKESVSLTTKDFKENLTNLEEHMQSVMNQKMTEGSITDVLITSKVIQ
ncbi:flagellar basal body-associated protein FliL [Gracilibacillus halophilus YIM-C55.5]|uniref:Flagellar protein FliL n=1 Tax=Gracilibacillus halophilus YIM-C55.5 TaxID=1308866 RepID=N4WYV5_9BACI|nr:flagellar basal body-associated FliL family protein [Gracilibacillus halophilus]ENH98231.1 flagellar basal body-associated protein FliL [Gracilibacillus halophilus YIM-C55.5]